MINKNKILIAVPAKNEQDRINSTVSSILPYGDVFLFDNNSEDNTVEIVSKLGTSIVTSPKPGYEAVIYHICNFFLESKYEILVIIDGDGEVGIKELPNGLLKISDVDGVIGNRNIKKRWAESIVCAKFFKKTSIKDIYCGFKILKRSAISKKMRYGTFGTGIINKRASFANIDVSVQPREGTRLGNELLTQLKILFCGLFGYYI